MCFTISLLKSAVHYFCQNTKRGNEACKWSVYALVIWIVCELQFLEEFGILDDSLPVIGK